MGRDGSWSSGEHLRQNLGLPGDRCAADTKHARGGSDETAAVDAPPEESTRGRESCELVGRDKAVLLAAIGGVVGIAGGSVITAVYADMRDWRLAVPLTGLAGGVAASLAVGALAGLYPASRASRLAPAEAVRSE